VPEFRQRRGIRPLSGSFSISTFVAASTAEGIGISRRVMIRLKQILVATDVGGASEVAMDYGRGAMAQVLLGSVAEKVVRTAPCPALIVRHPEREFIGPDATDVTANQESGGLS
jgi:hypothetical protein